MIETCATIIVTSGSLLLFAYWLRHACLLILTAKPPQDYARGAAIAKTRNFTYGESHLTTVEISTPAVENTK
jgi:hypothetical protein